MKRVTLICWALVYLLSGLPAAAQRVVLYVDGAVPGISFSRGDVGVVLEGLGLEKWPGRNQASEKIATKAFTEFRQAMYDQGDMVQARSAFERGYSAVSSLYSFGTETRSVLEGLWLGVHLELIEGRIEAAKQVAQTALRIGPSHQPPASDYSPRVRKVLQAASQSLRRLRITGLPIGCNAVVSGAGNAQRLIPGNYVVGLACNGLEHPWAGRTISWDGQSPVDVTDLAIWKYQEHLAVHGSSALKIAQLLLGKTEVEEVVIVRAGTFKTWTAIRLNREGQSQAPMGLSADGLRHWVLSEPSRTLTPETPNLHEGTWWGIGLASTGVALLVGALATRAAANSAIETVNQGTENRLVEAKRFQTATWALLGTGSALSVVGVVLALNYGLRDTRQPLESSVYIEPSLSGAILRF